MSKIKVRLKRGNVVSAKLKPKNGIKAKNSTVYLFDPTLIDGEVQLAQDWAIKTDGLVEEEGVGIDYSAKAYAIGGTGTTTNNAKYYAEQAGISETNASNSATSASGSASSASSSASLAKDWATKTDGTVDGVDYSSKYYAQQITPIATDITTVAGIASDVTTVANNSTNITTVAGNTTNINKVASDINSVNLVADDIDSVHTVAVDISTVIDVADNKTNIDAVAGNATNINAVAGNETNINAVAGNATNINAVNANKTNIDTVAGIASDVTAVANNETNINAVVANSTNINTVASDSTSINAVASDLTNIDAVANDLANIDNASTYANNAHIWAEGSDAQVAGLGGEKSSKGWAARAKELVDSIGSVLHYKGSVATRADLPTTGLVLGDMYNITSDGSNVVWNGSDWDDISGVVDLSAYRTASDQDTIDAGKVPTSRTVNGKALSSDISLTYSDVGAQQAGNYVTTDTAQTITEAKTFTKAVHFTGTGDTNAVFLTENTRFDIEGTTRTILGMGSAQFYINHSAYALLLRGKNARPSYNSATSYLALLSDLDGYVPTTRTVNGKELSSNISLAASDVGALPDSTVIPTVNDATLTIQKNGTDVATFTANSSTNQTANISVPTDTSDLTNGAGFITGINSSDVTTALGYTPYDASNPNGYTSNVGTVTSVNNTSPDGSGNVTLSIPTVNNSTITIQKNGTTVDSFTTNASSNKSINITVPTSAADVSALPSSTKYGADLSYSSNTLQLKDQDGNNLGSAVTISGGGSVDIDSLSITKNGDDELQTVGVIDQRDTTTALKQWSGTKAQYDAIVSKDSDTIYNVKDEPNTFQSLLETIYPVGSIYIGTMAICPMSALFGTWTLVGTKLVTNVDSTAGVIGNGKTLGLYGLNQSTGTETGFGIGTGSLSSANVSVIRADYYGKDIGTAGGTGQVPTVGYAIGVTSDPTKSGIEATVTSTSLTVNLWQRVS